MHAVSHSFAHRGPSASRTRARWQPYSSTPSSSTRSPSSAYSNTPASSVSTPASLSQQTLCDSVLRKRNPPPSLNALHKDTSLRDLHKSRYVNSLVELAVRRLCDMWPSHDIPLVFTAANRSTSTFALATTTFIHPSRFIQSQSSTSDTPSTSSPSCISAESSSSPSSPLSPSTSLSSVSSGSSHATTHNDHGFNALSLKIFVHEVLRRSRTSCNVLQTALCYLEAIRFKVPEVLQQEKLGHGVRGEFDQASRILAWDDPRASDLVEAPAQTDLLFPNRFVNPESYWSDIEPPTVRVLDDNPLATPCISCWQQGPPPLAKKPREPSVDLSPMPPMPSPLLCPRRTFLAALILASKFTHDKCYSNRAWAKLAGLPAREIGRCERALGEALEWRLWVGKSPPQQRVVARSKSDSDLLLDGAGASRWPEAPFGISTVGESSVPIGESSVRASMPPPPALRRRNTLPVDFSSPEKAPATTAIPMECSPATSTPAPSSSSAWSSIEVTPVTGVYGNAFIPPAPSDASPTPTLSFSPTSTDSSGDSIYEERTIQMGSFIDTPPSILIKPEMTHTYAYAGSLPTSKGGYLSEGGIAAAWGCPSWGVSVPEYMEEDVQY